jgi:hypothetical protein
MENLRKSSKFRIIKVVAKISYVILNIVTAGKIMLVESGFPDVLFVGRKKAQSG